MDKKRGGSEAISSLNSLPDFYVDFCNIHGKIEGLSNSSIQEK